MVCLGRSQKIKDLSQMFVDKWSSFELPNYNPHVDKTMKLFLGVWPENVRIEGFQLSCLSFVFSYVSKVSEIAAQICPLSSNTFRVHHLVRVKTDYFEFSGLVGSNLSSEWGWMALETNRVKNFILSDSSQHQLLDSYFIKYALSWGNLLLEWKLWFSW